jgi:hypothetical protein
MGNNLSKYSIYKSKQHNNECIMKRKQNYTDNFQSETESNKEICYKTHSLTNNISSTSKVLDNR